jgi:Trp operon repressor
VISEEKERLLDNVLDTISKWNEETLENFINTRLKVYNKLIETTKPQKKIKEVKGATLNRPVKNPVLC